VRDYFDVGAAESFREFGVEGCEPSAFEFREADEVCVA